MASRFLTQDAVLSGWSGTMSPCLNSQFLQHLAYNGGPKPSGSLAEPAPQAQPQAWKVVSFPAQRPGPPRAIHLASSVISKTRRLTGPKSPCRAMTSSQPKPERNLLLSYRSLLRAHGVPTMLSAVLVLNVLLFPWNYSRLGIRVYTVRVKATCLLRSGLATGLPGSGQICEAHSAQEPHLELSGPRKRSGTRGWPNSWTIMRDCR